LEFLRGQSGGDRGRRKGVRLRSDAGLGAVTGGEQVTCFGPLWRSRSTACKQEAGENSCSRPRASHGSTIETGYC
jgi:hypothetical protein